MRRGGLKATIIGCVEDRPGPSGRLAHPFVVTRRPPTSSPVFGACMLHCSKYDENVSLNELLGKYVRLQADLRAAIASPRTPEGHVDRLSAELLAAERMLAALQPADEQTNELLPFAIF
ncbi:MAG: hypothetical protein ABI364_00535 [Caldimonas sp.]